jgi:hypothetical protein
LQIRGLTHVMPIAEGLAKAAASAKPTAVRDAGSIALASDVWAPSGDVPPVTPVKLYGREIGLDTPADVTADPSADAGLPPDPVSAAAQKACGGGT